MSTDGVERFIPLFEIGKFAFDALFVPSQHPESVYLRRYKYSKLKFNDVSTSVLFFWEIIYVNSFDVWYF